MDGILVMRIRDRGIKYYIKKGTVHIDTGLNPQMFLEVMKKYVDEHGLEANE